MTTPAPSSPFGAASSVHRGTSAANPTVPLQTVPLHHAHTSASESSPHAHQHHTVHRFGALRNVELLEGKAHSTSRPFRLRHLLGFPRVRQWMIGRKLYREVRLVQDKASLTRSQVEAREVDRFVCPRSSPSL